MVKTKRIFFFFYNGIFKIGSKQSYIIMKKVVFILGPIKSLKMITFPGGRLELGVRSGE